MQRRWAAGLACALWLAASCPRADASTAHTAQAAAARGLRLSVVQQAHIHEIIDRNQLSGKTTLATARDVLRVLTPAQRDRLRTLMPPAKPR